MAWRLDPTTIVLFAPRKLAEIWTVDARRVVKEAATLDVEKIEVERLKEAALKELSAWTVI
jgi:hypothetical protein